LDTVHIFRQSLLMIPGQKRRSLFSTTLVLISLMIGQSGCPQCWMETGHLFEIAGGLIFLWAWCLRLPS
jgi:hypothetical protein